VGLGWVGGWVDLPVVGSLVEWLGGSRVGGWLGGSRGGWIIGWVVG